MTPPAGPLTRLGQLEHRERSAHKRWEVLFEYIANYPNPMNIRQEWEAREERDELRRQIGELRRELAAATI